MTKVAPSAAQAQASLAAGRYREAIEQFKTLSRAEPPEVWREGLAAAYRGRALELEAKGMGKEALTIWDNRRQACPGLAPDPRHLALLLRLGQSEAALTGYRSLLAGGESAALAELRGHFAAYWLTEALPPGLATDPALAEDPLLRDGSTARAALSQELDDFDHALLGTLIDEREFPPPDVYTFWTEVKDLIALPGHS